MLPANLPAGAAATSLRDEGNLTSGVENVIAGFSERFLVWYRTWQAQGFEKIRDVWLTRAHGLAGPIGIRLHSDTIDAIFVGVDETGALLAKMADGSSRRVTGVGSPFREKLLTHAIGHRFRQHQYRFRRL